MPDILALLVSTYFKKLHNNKGKFTMNRNLSFLAMFLICFLICDTVQAVVQYTITDLGNGIRSRAYSINGSGQVVGDYVSGVTNHAYLWQYGIGMQDLGTLGGTNSFGFGINDSGEVVGDAYPANNFNHHAFLKNYSGPMQDLGTLGGTDSTGYGINDRGEVVGWSHTTADANTHAFLWQNDNGMQDLGTLGGINSFAMDINNIGLIVGSSVISDGGFHAFLWQNDSGMQDLGTLGGTMTRSEANAVNYSGQVVGYCETSTLTDQHAFIWQKSIGMQDLNNLIAADSGWMLQIANDINDAGQIVGYGFNGNGDSHAFLLTPVPEPSIIVFLCSALAGLGWVVLVRRR
ncbi:MAG: DUF3466 family protein [Thermoguttaceae bacterium]|jgi:probable HAF family extracellular repeat protein